MAFRELTPLGHNRRSNSNAAAPPINRGTCGIQRRLYRGDFVSRAAAVGARPFGARSFQRSSPCDEGDALAVVGHLDPDFVRVMDDIKKLLRLVFQTSNEITFPVSGTGSAGMETALVNLVEEGDDVPARGSQ
jgi:hypothetical protein